MSEQQWFCPRCAKRYPAASPPCPDDGVQLLELGQGDDLSGTVIRNKYLLVKRLGQGAFGAVYRALHLLAKAEMAIKIIRREHSENPDIYRRALKEAQIVMRLQSPHTVVVHDVDEDAQLGLYIVMEFLKGRSLEDHLNDLGPQGRKLPAAEAVRLGRQVCLALEEAHSKGIIHRDLKPANVMLVQGGDGKPHVKVVDFGIARLSQSMDSGLTMTQSMDGHRISGTPTYMSPEQCRGEVVDGRADLYGLGVMLYELLCGERPFAANTTQGMLIAHCVEPPRPLSARFPELNVPSGLETVVMRLLEKDRERRPANAAETAELLATSLEPGVQDTLLRGVPTLPQVDLGTQARDRARAAEAAADAGSAPGEEPARPAGSRAWVVPVVIVVALAGAAAAWFATRGGAPAPTDGGEVALVETLQAPEAASPAAVAATEAASPEEVAPAAAVEATAPAPVATPVPAAPGAPPAATPAAPAGMVVSTNAQPPAAAVAPTTAPTVAAPAATPAAAPDRAALQAAYTEIYCAQARGDAAGLVAALQKHGYRSQEAWMSAWKQASADPTFASGVMAAAQKACAPAAVATPAAPANAAPKAAQPKAPAQAAPPPAVTPAATPAAAPAATAVPQPPKAAPAASPSPEEELDRAPTPDKPKSAPGARDKARKAMDELDDEEF